LPCLESSTDCISRLTQRAIESSQTLKDLTAKIEEAQNIIAQAKERNNQTISISTFSPFLQAYFLKYGIFRDTATQNLGTNPFELIVTNLVSTFFGRGIASLIPIENLFPQEGAADRAISIGDLQIKVAELERLKGEVRDKLVQVVLEETLKLDEIVRDFQINQEIAKRDKARLTIIEVSYRFGEGDTASYLNELSKYDRQKAQAWKSWSQLRSQIAKVKLLVLGVGREEN
jgi:hypothetical protein